MMMSTTTAMTWREGTGTRPNWWAANPGTRRSYRVTQHNDGRATLRAYGRGESLWTNSWRSTDEAMEYAATYEADHLQAQMDGWQ